MTSFLTRFIANTRMENVTGFTTQHNKLLGMCVANMRTKNITIFILDKSDQDLVSVTQDSWLLKFYLKRINCCSFLRTERWKDTYRHDLSLPTMKMPHNKQNCAKCIFLLSICKILGRFMINRFDIGTETIGQLKHVCQRQITKMTNFSVKNDQAKKCPPPPSSPRFGTSNSRTSRVLGLRSWKLDTGGF